MRRTMGTTGLVVGLLLGAGPAAAQETVAALTLDGNSFVSIEDQEVYPIPAGVVIPFHFAAPDAGGRSAVRIDPADVGRAKLPLGHPRDKLWIDLVEPATGLLRPTSDGRAVVEFQVRLLVTLDERQSSGSKEITLRFTTESTDASSADGSTTVRVGGTRLDPVSRNVRFVAARTNAPDDIPGPGAAVYVVLSGAFDTLPGS
jgi:hypothetical protein